MTVLVLDTRALELLADRKADPKAAQRMRDILDAADRDGVQVRVPTAVLAEAYRGTPADAAIDRILGTGIRLITLGQAMARQTGGHDRRRQVRADRDDAVLRQQDCQCVAERCGEGLAERRGLDQAAGPLYATAAPLLCALALGMASRNWVNRSWGRVTARGVPVDVLGVTGEA